MHFLRPLSAAPMAYNASYHAARTAATAPARAGLNMHFLSATPMPPLSRTRLSIMLLPDIRLKVGFLPPNLYSLSTRPIVPS